MEPGPGWEMTNRLVDDPDPQVRQKAADVLFLFNAEASRPAAERLLKDPDPAVADVARRAIYAIEMAYKQEQLFGKR